MKRNSMLSRRQPLSASCLPNCLPDEQGLGGSGIFLEEAWLVLRAFLFRLVCKWTRVAGAPSHRTLGRVPLPSCLPDTEPSHLHTHPPPGLHPQGQQRRRPACGAVISSHRTLQRQYSRLSLCLVPHGITALSEVHSKAGEERPHASLLSKKAIVEGEVGEEDPDHSDLFSGRCGSLGRGIWTRIPLNSVPGCPCKVSCSLSPLLLTGHEKNLFRTSG
uniref:Uncharacterized protein n=1 Tax=Rousettus aegyptiacus TaxID=9407 RepID=A0A7J8BA52_ROUAE|nr:hypothetical protein HJG63_009908 [Rousettus aegyptiacus]